MRKPPVEKEVKLGAGPAFHLPNLEGVVEGAVVGAPEVLRLETVYHDTADLRLARWGVSLRHRGGEGWTLKLASIDPPKPGATAGALERSELTYPGGPKKVPEAALAVVRAYVRSATVVPVARLSTVRRRVRLNNAAGARLAEVVDDEVSVRDGRRVAARFREIEVEVPTTEPDADGASAPSVLEPLVNRLRGAGAGAPDPTPKHIRALGPRALEPPEVAPTPVQPQSPAKDVIRSVFAESVAWLLRHDPLVRTSGDPEAIHQARVATRKLRSHLRTFAPLLAPEWTEPLRTELGWLGLALGAVRDREVLLDRLRDRAKGLPVHDQKAAESLLTILAKEITDLRKKVIVDLDSARYVELLERLVQAAAAPVTLADGDLAAIGVLPLLATGPWRRLRSAVRQLPENPTDPELHRIRILAKRARYAAEAVEPVAGPAAASFGRAAAKLQTVLGEHQDSVTAQAWLRSVKTGGRRAFAAGELIAMEHIAAAKARASWPKAWDALDRKPLRTWMP